MITHQDLIELKLATPNKALEMKPWLAQAERSIRCLIGDVKDTVGKVKRGIKMVC